MPQERDSQFPFPTAEEVEAAPGDRAAKAARNIVSRRIDGIPKRAYVMGECDHAPVVQGVRDFAEEVYALIEAIPPDQMNGTLGEKAHEVRKMMEDHRCPTSAAS